jgi:BlaI family penicillinase repressor
MVKSRGPRHPAGRFTSLELDVMKVLWNLGPANVRTVQDQIKRADLAYTTVQTMLNILCRKGKVRRRLKNCVYFYDPLISRQEAATQAVDDIIERFFDGSVEGLVLKLLENRYLTAESLAQIRNAGPPSWPTKLPVE